MKVKCSSLQEKTQKEKKNMNIIWNVKCS